MDPKYIPDIYGNKQIKIQKDPWAQKPFIPQATGTSQIPVDMSLSNIDLIRRVVSLEDRVDRLDGLFGISTVTINTLGDRKWEIKQPLNVAVEQRGPEDFVACLYDINLYGYGDSIPDALEDLKLMIINQYEYLIDQEGRIELSISLKNQIKFLKKYMVELNA